MKLDSSIYIRLTKRDRRRLDRAAAKATKETGFRQKASTVARKIIQDYLEATGL